MRRLERALQKIAEPDSKFREPIERLVDEQSSIKYSETRTHSVNHELLRERRVVSLEKYGTESETFRLLRTKVLKQLRDKNWNSIGITAPTQGAGKSMVSVNLAVAMAKEVNQTILLVDLDLRYPKVHWYFGIKVEKGLRDYLTADDVSLSEILINPGIERLVILPGRGRAVGSSELLTGPKMRQIVQEIKQRYQSRIIIFDLPPVLASDDVLASLDFFDASILVVEDGGSKAEDITKSLQMLSGTHILGTVLNKAEKTPDHIGYF